MARQTARQWERGLVRIKKKVEWSRRKFISVEVSGAKEWIQRVAAGGTGKEEDKDTGSSIW